MRLFSISSRKEAEVEKRTADLTVLTRISYCSICGTQAIWCVAMFKDFDVCETCFYRGFFRSVYKELRKSKMPKSAGTKGGVNDTRE